MDFRLLGPLEVLDGGRPVAVQGPKPRALLALLLLREGRAVSDDRLIDDLWGEAPPPTARAALQMHVSALRKALGPATVVRTETGYAVPLAGHTLDVQRVEQLLAVVRASEPAAAAAAAREALALWRGEPEVDAARLEQLRRELVERRLRAELELGGSGELVPELRELTAAEPLDEGLSGLLALALYRAGRQTEALDELARVRQTLDEELGLEPGPDLQRLQRAILVHEASLQPSAVSVPPLPAAATPLLGRERELADLAAALAGEARLVTLTGPGGIGKTSLALEALRRGDAPAAVVPLAEIDDPPLVADAIAGGLGLELRGRPPLDEVADWLRQTGAVLLLDNFEQVVTAASLVGALLGAAPSARVVVTSRTPLRLPGELELAVPPLADAAELFVARARGSVDDLATVRAICDRLDHIPLAVELAAARTRLLSPRELLDRLDEQLALLAAPARGLPERQRTMRAAIDWSVRLLGEDERTLLARFGVFAGGAALDAVEEVCGEGIDVLDALEQLVDQSLLRVGRDGDARRFSLLEPIRQYAAELLAAGGEEERLRDRHEAWLVRRVGVAADALGGPDQERWVERLEADLPNLRAALARALQRGDADTALALAGGTRRFWRLRGRLDEGERWLAQALAVPGGRPELRRQVASGLGMLRGERGDYAGARVAIELALELARAGGDDDAVVAATINFGVLMLQEGDEARAEELYREALALARACGNARLESGALENIGCLFLAQDAVGEAVDMLVLAADAARRAGDARAVAAVDAWLGRARIAQGDLAAAAALLQGAIETSRRLGHPQGVAVAVGFAAAFAAAAGDAPAAARLLGASEAVWSAADARRTDDYGRMQRQLREQLEGLLGADAVERERALGLAADVDEATSLAGAMLAPARNA